jgi:hemoglobin-like flavoprotein
MRRQRQLLREALVHLIAYSTGNEFSRSRIAELAESHSRMQLNVRPELYEIWIDSLTKAVRRHDDQYTPDLEAAWRRVIAPGVEAIKAAY